MKVIRMGVFETNSSSTHSITMCSKEDYNKWEKGELLFDMCKEKFVPLDKQEEYKTENKWCELITSEEYWDDEYLETFEETFTTKSGEKIVAFGKYGYDG